MWENGVGEVARSLVDMVFLALNVPNPARTIPSDLVPRAKPIVEGAMNEYRGSIGSSEEKRREAWIPHFIEVFKLLGGQRLEEHPRALQFSLAVDNDRQTVLLLSARAYTTASSYVIPSSWSQALSERLLEWSNEFEIRRLELNLRRGSTLASGTELVCAPDDPLAYCKPRDPRANDTLTARRIEQFRRRMEAECERPVRVKDMVAYLGYKDTTMLQRVSREAKNASTTAIKAVFQRLLKCASSEEFWSVVFKRRKFQGGLK
jgi:hypothetical protein